MCAAQRPRWSSCEERCSSGNARGQLRGSCARAGCSSHITCASRPGPVTIERLYKRLSLNGTQPTKRRKAAIMRSWKAVLLFGLVLSAGLVRAAEEAAEPAEDAEDEQDYADEERAFLIVRKYIKEELAVQGRNLTVYIEAYNAGTRCVLHSEGFNGSLQAAGGPPGGPLQIQPTSPRSHYRERATSSRRAAAARRCPACPNSQLCPTHTTDHSPPLPTKQRRERRRDQGRRAAPGLCAAGGRPRRVLRQARRRLQGRALVRAGGQDRRGRRGVRARQGHLQGRRRRRRAGALCVLAAGRGAVGCVVWSGVVERIGWVRWPQQSSDRCRHRGGKRGEKQGGPLGAHSVAISSRLQRPARSALHPPHQRPTPTAPPAPSTPPSPPPPPTPTSRS
jgi:hypothetical protein